MSNISNYIRISWIQEVCKEEFAEIYRALKIPPPNTIQECRDNLKKLISPNATVSLRLQGIYSRNFKHRALAQKGLRLLKGEQVSDSNEDSTEEEEKPQSDHISGQGKIQEQKDNNSYVNSNNSLPSEIKPTDLISIQTEYEFTDVQTAYINKLPRETFDNKYANAIQHVPSENRSNKEKSIQTKFTEMPSEKVPKITPDNFSGKQSEDIKNFFTKFDTMAKIYNWNEETKMNILPAYLQNDAAIVFETLRNIKKIDAYEQIKLALLAHFIKDDFELKTKLEKRIINADEDISTYYLDVINLCTKVDPGMKEKDICDNVIKGLTATQIAAISLLDNSTLEKLRSNLSKIQYRDHLVEKRIEIDLKKTVETLEKQIKELTIAKEKDKINALHTPNANQNNEKEYSFRYNYRNKFSPRSHTPNYGHRPKFYENYQPPRQNYYNNHRYHNNPNYRGFSQRGNFGYASQNPRYYGNWNTNPTNYSYYQNIPPFPTTYQLTYPHTNMIMPTPQTTNIQTKAKGKKTCETCKKSGHTTEECYAKLKN